MHCGREPEWASSFPVSTALAILLAPLAAAALVTGVGAVRDRDPRHVSLLAVIGLLGGQLVHRPPFEPTSLEHAFEPAAVPYLLALALTLAVWWLAIAATRSLHERDRAEQAHGRDVEALRELANLLRRAEAHSPANADALLAFGCRRYGFETGLVARIGDDDGEILCLHDTRDDGPLTVGPCPDLVRTLVQRCALTDDVVDVGRASGGHWNTHPEHAPFGWESFLGIRIDEGPVGARVLCFASCAPRSETVSGAERMLLTVAASWLGRPAVTGSEEADKALVPAEEGPPLLALNDELTSLEPRLRRGLAAGRPLGLELDAAAPRVALGAGELERVVASMLTYAGEAGPDDAPIRLRTGIAQPPQPGAPGFSTVSVCALGPALDADALAALYDAPVAPAHESGLRQLPLPRVVRLLRDRGGDLSMESQAEVGTTLTAFLPTRRTRA